ncbi:beta-propeller fold lactonase family protein [Pseudoalteromonas obscura]|uniref:Beta-propeller fold lactonase family protein n=1 Tax=Pseudoalteromonas obscura TaxID=3048491 RepID=A0ABT7EJ18_9GAMM|nr:beta-propeller fold lactonase family protein [Pseudoalteromonas sp. P94(2023)]MDK2595042.1 beta-propeller fold lactonase family protein [Pseudoalteromonas sp. P94(2023)]
MNLQFLTAFCFATFAFQLYASTQPPANSTTIKLKQVIRHAGNQHFEVANPRDAWLTDNNTLLIVSGDSNSLSIFNPSKHHSFAYSQSFSKQNDQSASLEGASSISFLKDADIAIVSAFYSGSLSTFKLGDKGQFNHIETVSDHLDIKQAFTAYQDVKDQDTLDLVGAWDTHIVQESQRLYVASYQSNAVGEFKVSDSGKLTPLGRLLPKYDWGRPTSISQPKNADWLYINGFEQSKISVLSKTSEGKFSVTQTIQHDKNGVKSMLNPQQLIVTPDNQFLFVAASKSNALNVFKKDTSARFNLHQVVTSEQNPGLSGACCLAFSDNQNTLFVAGETDKGILIFDFTPSTGKLRFRQHITELNRHQLTGVSSLRLSEDEKQLIVTTGKNNEIFILNLG